MFDLPDTQEITKDVIGGYRLSDRVTTCVGDYFKDGLGHDNDAVLISAILHSLGPDNCMMLPKKAYYSLAGGGLVIVSERLIDPEEISPLGVSSSR